MSLEKNIKINVDTKKANKDVGKLNDNIERTGDAAEKTSKSGSKMTSVFKGLGTTLKAMGIGLIITAIAGLGAAFSKNQRIIDAFSTATETLSIFMSKVTEALFNVYDAVTKSSENFDALGRVIKGILTIAITPLKLSFYAIKLGIKEAQLAWEKSFFGDKDKNTIKELNKDIKETKEAFYEAGENAVKAGVDIYKSTGEAIGEIKKIGTIAGKELSKVSLRASYEQAKVNVELKNTAQLAAATQQGLIEKYDLQAEKLRQIRDNDLIGIKERQKANNELKEVLKEQEKAMLANANAVIASAQAEYNKNKTIENQVALIEALNEKEGVRAQITGFMSEQEVNRTALIKERYDLEQAIAESENERRIAQMEFDAQQETNETLRFEKMLERNELEKQIKSDELQAKIDSYALGTQARVDAENELNDFLQENANERVDIENEKNRKILENEQRLKDAKIQIAQNITSIIGAIAGKNSKVAKGMAAAQAIINTYKGVTSALSAPQMLPDPIGTILRFTNAAAVGVAGFKSVKEILKTDEKGKKITASASAVSTPSVAASPPSFNIVKGTGSNQITEGLKKQQQPVKAYVVSKDVTTGQELDRNIITESSI